MSSTLLDLQRINLKKMEATETSPSNEASIIPSRTPSLEEVNDTLIIASSEPVSEVLDEASIIPSPPPKPSTRKLAAGRTSKTDLKELPKDPLREALDSQLRVHLMEQLMPMNGKAPVTRLNVEMPEDLHQQLKQHCVKTRTPIKALINALIALYLEAEEEA